MTDESTYFYRRAERELELAQRATHPDAVQAHYELANAYLAKLPRQEPKTLVS